MECVILAAESSLAPIKKTARALLHLDEQRSQVERQVHLLSLLGFRPDKITLVMNEEHFSDTKLREIIDKLPCQTFTVKPTRSSAETFSEFSKTRAGKEKLLVVFGDALLEVRHLESLLSSAFDNSLLVRTPLRISEAGLKLHLEPSGKVVASFDYEKCPWPWAIFSGAMLVGSGAQADLVESCRDPEAGESIAEHLVNICHGGVIGLVEADRTMAQRSADLWINSELRGGSFASLERKDVVVKSAKGPAASKLQNEVSWLRGLPNDVKPFFTKVLSSQVSDDDVSYEMPYYKLSSVRDKLMVGSLSTTQLVDFMDRLLTFLFERIYSIEKSRETRGWFASRHLDRVLERTRVASGVSPTLRRLVSANELVINGRLVSNPLSVVQKIRDKRSLLMKLDPASLRMIHGDLHFQNILIGGPQDDSPFVIVDPRGELQGSDVYYDMGKLFHSFRGKYDLLHTNQFDLTIHPDSQIESRESRFIADLEFSSAALEERYDTVGKHLTPVILNHLEHFGESRVDAYSKSLVSEGMHFSSLLPFHVSGSEPENKAVAMYLTGALLLDDFMAAALSD